MIDAKVGRLCRKSKQNFLGKMDYQQSVNQRIQRL